MGQWITSVQGNGGAVRGVDVENARDKMEGNAANRGGGVRSRGEILTHTLWANQIRKCAKRAAGNRPMGARVDQWPANRRARIKCG